MSDQAAIEQLGIDECLRLLATAHVGRLAFVVGGKPQIKPLNYALADGSVVVRTVYGDTLDLLAERPAVAFEVDDIDPEHHRGWSVVVHGRCEEVWRPDELGRLRRIPLRPWAPGARDHYLRILSAEITGRRIR